MSSKKPASKTHETEKTPVVEGVKSLQELREEEQRLNKRAEVFSSYIFKVLKQVEPSFAGPTNSMKIMNSFVKNIFERVAKEGSRLVDTNERVILDSNQIHIADKKVLSNK